MSFKDNLTEWDELTIKPIFDSIGKTIATAGIKGVVNPIANIAGGAVVAVIENGSEIYCAYQEAVSTMKKNREKNRTIRKIDKKITEGLENLYDQMIDMTLDQNEKLTIGKLRDIYIRVQLLNNLAVNNNSILMKLDKNFKSLISTLPDGKKVLEENNTIQ